MSGVSGKRLIITSVISLIMVSVLLIGSTYSIFTSEDVDEYANVYTTGVLDVTYIVSSDNVKLEDATPIADKDNIYIKPYRISITNNGNVPYKFNIILNNTTATTSIDTNYIMAQVGKLEPVVLGSTTDNIIKSDIIVEANSSVDVDVRVYIKEDIPNSEIGKNFSATLSIDGLAIYNDSGVINNDDLVAIYEKDVSNNAAKYVQNLYNDGSSINTVNIGGNSSNPSVSLNATQSIMLDNNGNYRYYGSDPNNYVWYNDELWRIISVENVKSNENDTVGENRVKIVKATKLTDDNGLINYSYDSSDSTINSGYGVNDWSKSDLMTELNTLYYDSTSGTCYGGESNASAACDFTNTGLSDEAKKLTGDALYYLGGIGGSITDNTIDIQDENYFVDDFYIDERGVDVWPSTTGSTCDDGACPRAITWTGKIGIMYPSDFFYATDLSVCTVNNVIDFVKSEVCGNDWLFHSEDATDFVSLFYTMFFITPFSVAPQAVYYFGGAQGNGGSSYLYVPTYLPIYVYPVQYLRTNVFITGGSGSADDPYQLEGSDVIYTIKYDANGGSGGPSSQNREEGEDLIISSVEPTRLGYEFLGWSVDPEATTATYEAGEIFNIGSSVTLYAVWKEAYIVSYDANGGSGAPDAQTKFEGKNLTLSSIEPTRLGYEFLGWGTTIDDTTATYQPGDVYGEDASVTLYAVWKDAYIVSYDANEGTGAPDAQTKFEGKNLTLSSTVPTRTGYNFLGWGTTIDATEATYQPEDVYSIDASVTLYAVWQIKTYTISYDANGGTGAPEAQTKIYGVDLTLSSTIPTRDGYVFLGWGSKTATTATYEAGGTFSSNYGRTLYAVWGDIPIYAIYSIDDNSLTFYKNTDVVTVGDTYNSKVVTAIYTDISSYQFGTPWASDYGTSITSAVIADKMSPISTQGWFQDLENCEFIDVEKLDISQTKNAAGMFSYTGYNVTTFTIKGLDNWDTSSVTNMRYMFHHAGESATTWNIGDLSGWDTSSVTDMGGMFGGAGESATTWSVGDLSSWDTSSVTDMSSMFNYAGYSATTWSVGDLSGWDTSKVTDMSSMFSHAGRSATTWSVGDLSGWDTSSATDMSSMFDSAGYSATTFDISYVSKWDTSSVTNMSSMFNYAGCSATTWSVGDLSSWDTSLVTDMSGMFNGAGYSATTFDISYVSKWDISSVTNMSWMFSSAGYSATIWSIGDLSGWDTSSVTYMNSMFQNTGYSATTFDISYVSKWDTSSVTSMSQMFFSAGYSATTWSVGDLSSWDTSSATDMSSMFYHAGESATTWSVGDLSGWDTSSVTYMNSMFHDTGYSATTWSVGDLSDWDTSSVTSMSQMFYSAGYSATTWNVGDLSGWDTSSVTDMSSMFYYAGYGATTFDISYVSKWDTSSVTDMSSMFYYAGPNATTWSVGDLSGWDTSSVTDMRRMFNGAGNSATTWSVGDLSGWDTSSVTSMSQMFYYAGYSATTWSVGDLSGWDTSSVTDMSYMFYYAGESATTWSVGDLSNWDTSSVTSMSGMFYGAGESATTWSVGDLSGWDTSSVTSMSGMFRYAGHCATTWSVGDLSDWDTSSVTNMSYMFNYAGYNATWSLDCSSWNVNNVTSYTDFNTGAESKVTVPTWVN